jgi:hypothetical protein
VIVSFVPSAGMDDVGKFEMKLILGVLAFLVPALVIYQWNVHRFGKRSVRDAVTNPETL